MRVWKRSSYCDGGACVEVSAEAPWRRSSRCDGGQCVDVRASDAGVQVRDGKDPDGPVLDITPTQWRFVLDWIRADEVPVGVATGPDGVFWNGLDGAGLPVSLGFTYEEWDAFVAGVKLGEFDYPAVSIEGAGVPA